MTARRTFHCRACKDGRCEDCVRFVWDGEGCVHACFADRQLKMFDLVDLELLVSPRRDVEGQEHEDVDW